MWKSQNSQLCEAKLQRDRCKALLRGNGPISEREIFANPP
jgi:hypothetical protein